jgi:hypothetical protein
MSFLGRMNGRVFSGHKGPHGNRRLSSRKVSSRKPDRRLTMEHMESRVMMSANPISNVGTHDIDRLLAPALFAPTNHLGASLAAAPSGIKALAAAPGGEIISPNPNPIPIYISPPSAPTLTATPYSSTQIILSWNSASGATSYVVEEIVPARTIYVFGSPIHIPGYTTQLASLGSGVTSYEVTGLAASSTYGFEVIAEDATAGAPSNQVSVTTGLAVDHPTAATAYSIVSGTLFGPNGPSYLDVQQGQVGDCWLLASLAEVAARDPQDIRTMFTSAGTTVENGTTVNLYTVRFYQNGVPKYVTVDTELPSGGAYYDHPQNGVLWVALAEKAYAQANGQGDVTTGSSNTDSYAALNDGWPSWALSAITSKPAGDFAINPSNIVSAWDSGQLVCLCTSTPASQYIVASHCYALVNYNPSSGLPFEVYNPWGTTASGFVSEGGYYGLFNANSAFIAQNFTTNSFGTGASDDLRNKAHLTPEIATDLVMAGWAA